MTTTNVCRENKVENHIASQPTQLYIIIPVLNEESNVARLAASLKHLRILVGDQLHCHALIVDDGSSDHTRLEFEKHADSLPLTILSHADNQGPGAAFATGFSHLAGKLRDGDWVATMEGDSTSRIDTLLHMLTRRHEGYDAVLASPYAYGGGITGVEYSRVFLSHCANALAKVILGLRGFHTLSSFYRIYSSSIVLRLQEHYGAGIIEFAGFECMVELLLKLVMIGARISEVEMSLDWSTRRGRSKMRLLKAMSGYLSLLRTGWKWRRNARNGIWRPLRKSSRCLPSLSSVYNAPRVGMCFGARSQQQGDEE
jgi:dolichol-phosphate mannosyltransferase